MISQKIARILLEVACRHPASTGEMEAFLGERKKLFLLLQGSAPSRSNVAKEYVSAEREGLSS